MALWVFIIASLNIALGFALAIWLENPFSFRWNRNGRGRISSRAGRIKASEPAKSNAQAGPQWHFDTAGFPLAWLDTLRNRTRNPRSVFEAILWILLTEQERQRTPFAELHSQLLAATAERPSAAVIDVAINGVTDLVSQTLEFARMITSAKPHDELLKTFVETGSHVLDEMREVRSTITSNYSTGTDETERVTAETGLRKVYAGINQLRDLCLESLACILAVEKRLDEVSEEDRLDRQTNTMSRFGLATLLDEWLTKDTDRVRVVSIALVDVDGCDVLNETYGFGNGDLLIGALGRILSDAVRKDRGFDRVVRVAGQRFLMFLGDTATRNATSGTERIRQTVESQRFMLGNIKVELTITSSVGEWGKTQEPAELLAQLGKALNETKATNRNSCCAVEAGIARAVTSAKFRIKPAEIQLLPADVQTPAGNTLASV